MTGKNQSYARCLNNRLVMRELRKADSSATMLSRGLDLSNAALSSIICELEKGGYIRKVTDDEVAATTSVGRRPVYYSVNEKFGCVAAVGLANHRAQVVISDMKMQITDFTETRVERYDVATVYELVLSLKNLLAKPEYRDVPLLGIDVSVPGRVNTMTGELQLSPQFDKDLFGEKNYIVNLFSRQFGVTVKMTNDIDLAGHAEMHRGLLAGVENGMLVHVDEGIGGALVLGGKLYSGSQGFAGEVGRMRTEFEGRRDALDEFVSLRAVKARLGVKHTAEALALYESDAAAREYVLATARCLGGVLKDIVELLDISTVVVSGRATGFGDEYMRAGNEQIAEAVGSCTAVPTTLGGNASVIGAVAKAVESITDAAFE